MAAQRDEIVSFCNDLLRVSEFHDYCLNGLQLEGRQRVTKIISGVSLSAALVQTAAKKRAQMIIVHHGIFQGDIPTPPFIGGTLRGRLKLLLDNDISLCGYHLPLDAHPKIGNNAALCQLLGVSGLAPFDVGFIGELQEPVPFPSFLGLVNSQIGCQAFSIAAGPKKVHRVAIVSGGASPDYEKAVRAGADTFLCGDVRENVVRGVEELKINFINAGHYNTEKLGVQNLSAAIRKKFRIPADFVDIPNAV